jgi:hypothetical protein
MQLTPELAAELLAADLNNIVLKIRSGGTLTADQAKRIAEHHAPPPGFAFLPDDLPAQPAPAPVAPVVAEAPASKRLLPGVLDGYAVTYVTSSRQIRRWLTEGAPLHDPAAMPAWWEGELAAGRKRWGLPDRILQASRLASAPAPDESPGSASPSFTLPASSHMSTGTGDRINLEDYDPEEGDRLRELKQIQAARYTQLKNALAAGNDTVMLETKYLRLTETLDKMESRVSERLKKRGLYIARPEVERELATAAELIRQMGESEARRLLELCPDLTASGREQILRAVPMLAEARARVFRTLGTLRTTDDALLELRN